MSKEVKMFIFGSVLFIQQIITACALASVGMHILYEVLPVSLVLFISIYYLLATLLQEPVKIPNTESCPRCHSKDTTITSNSSGDEILHCQDCGKVFVKNVPDIFNVSDN